eukprot:850564_1
MAYCWCFLLSLILPIFAQDCDSNFNGLAMANFNGDFGVYGDAEIYANGSFILDITIDGGLDLSICGGNDPYPLQYHIHQKWDYEDSKDRYGADCGPDYTGGHYNPYGKPPCKEVDTATYFNCEIGDISGRFGEVRPNLLNHIRTENYLNDGNCLCGRLTPEMAYTRSVVFHCNDGTRLFCAPFNV